ncbi:MAG: adenosine kinase [Deltaproteobacteria bacterium]|nr:adenosine kinase [Candidatus Zymogenaceae bacterium]
MIATTDAMKKQYDVCGIGSPLLDFIVEVDEGLLAEIDMKKGRMHLIDEGQSKRILGMIERFRVKTAPGGSSANTLAGVSALGGSAVFLGKIGDDYHGTVYEQSTVDSGVSSRLARHKSGTTGHAITFITPDSERTFATHLGAALHFRTEDVLDDDIRQSRILHIEGYQLEDPELKQTCIHAIQVTRASGGKVSIDLADPALIGRNLEPIRDLVREYADIIFVNELEARAFTGTDDEEQALSQIYDVCEVAVVKLGDRGSLIKAEGKVIRVPIYPVQVVNSNGAGDAYAAGILFSITHGIDYERAGKIAAYVAAQVVGSVGARPDRSLIDEIRNL